MYIRNMVLSYTTKKTRHEPIRLWNFFHMIPCFYKKSRHLASLDSHLWMKIYFKAKDIIYEDEDKKILIIFMDDCAQNLLKISLSVEVLK